MTDIRVIPSHLNPKDLPNDYSFFVAALGFERRARYVAQTLSPIAQRRIAWGFSDRRELSYPENAEWFCVNGYEIFDDPDDSHFLSFLEGVLEAAPAALDVVGCVDISSMTRKRMAAIVEMFCSGKLRNGASIDFIYSLGAYSAPPSEFAPNTHFGPISPFFAGWTTNPNKPPVAIVGLGYEEGKALGATEYIQADEAWVFIPESSIVPYLPAVLDANSTLLKFLPKRQQITYRLDDPVGCYQLLESLLYGVMPFGRPIILPFGPKIFALMALLACTRHGEASVWRVSAQQSESPVERFPSEHVIGVRVAFHY